MNTQDKAQRLNVYGRRIMALRAKDPHFDALCDAYVDLNRQISEQGVATGATRIETERLKRQRASCLDTILFMLDDANGVRRHAA